MCVLTGDMVRNWHPSLRDFGNEAAQQQDHFEEMVAYVAKCWPGTDIFGVRGNHDWFDYTVGACKGFDQPGRTTMAMGVVESYMWNGMVVSGFRGVTVHTGFWQDEFPDRYFEGLIECVDPATEILITHTPPYGILDDMRCVDELPVGHNLFPRNIGVPAVRELVLNRLPKLKLHMFGHCHEQGGKVQTRNGKIFSNAAVNVNWVVL